MIRARYSPDAQYLVEQLKHGPFLLGIEGSDAVAVIDGLKDLGYEISIEVEVHGAVEAAFNSLKGDTSDYMLHQRPVRRIKI